MNVDGAEDGGWELDPEDDAQAAVETVGRQLKLWREAAGLRPAEFAAAVGYGENLIYKIERGTRIPRPEYLDKADEVLGAGGKVAAMKKDVEQARYPKKVRDLTRWEAEAVELGAYGSHNLHGLLQTEEYARALFEMRRPAWPQDKVDREVAARVTRRSIFDRTPAPALTFVQEEVTLRRPLGGTMVLRRQLERLLEVGQLRNVEIQVMPTDREDHAGMGGRIQLLKFGDGSVVGHSDGQFGNRRVSHPKEIQVLELRYGIIRAQALTPRESLAFIEKVLGETCL
ncbi:MULTISPECIES: helix-turn-helix transcriptional regulator [unclassified Streptomyces]|uniref:helix-turn-helix domain-containing protein n=1 Tax=unclassified Streptomyces TaxID=2593676 RepID=UPI0008871218|nr:MULTISPECIES: helix-turn-helix transcriptional regulator [unclassified Streptomyces]PBC83812.1 helix-turn-helix protein [Streptomyces sp. 2321.6]SDR38402.1 Helix-turn-helix domain-containing protein [Streptomyces sp. KS_16]SED09753.1 Helix-turn-helix domain-containing protein [Streptomyces sp. 2133.1]SNC69891.1 Helix-turn-helix domain-containing protein [Streptomyces sp. 2114.4]